MYKSVVSFVRRRDDSLKLQGETLLFMQRMWDLVHALDVRSKRMAKQLGVTGPQRLVIRVLGKSPDLTARELADTLGIDPSTLTGILRRLEKQDMIIRHPDPDDGRRVRFELTAKGRRIDRERRGTVEAAVRRALGRASKSTIDHTIEMLLLVTEELARED